MLHICHSNSFGWCNRCISIERWRSFHNPRSHHRSKIFSSVEDFFSFLLSPACVQKPSLRPSGAVARDASQWDRRPSLRFEITLRGFSNRQKLPSIIEHSWLMQWMQLDKASNFLMLLAVKIQDCVWCVFKAGHLDGTFRTHFLCKHPGKAPKR